MDSTQFALARPLLPLGAKLVSTRLKSMDRETLQRWKAATAIRLVDIDSADPTKPMLVEMPGDPTTGLGGLADIDTTPPIPEHIDVRSLTELRAKPALEGPFLCVPAVAFSFLRVPTSSPLHTLLELLSRKLDCQGLGRKVLEPPY
jgi:hypothetical protein